MEAIQHLVPLVFAVSLAILVASVGLNATLDDALFLFRRPVRLLKAILAVNVIVPLAAVVIVSILPISTISKAGLILMSVSPCPPLVPGAQLKAGARKAFAYGVYVAMILLAVVIVPISVAIMGALYGVELSIGYGVLAINVGVTVVLPLAIGIAVHHRFPGFAERAAPVLAKGAMLLLLLALIPMLAGSWSAMADLMGDGTVLAVVLMVLAALAGGHLLGGPDFHDRVALAVAAATRHPGIALMIAGANFTDKRATAAILLVLLAGLLATTPYKLWAKRREAGAATAAP